MPEKNYFCDIRVINHNNSNEKESIKNLDLHTIKILMTLKYSILKVYNFLFKKKFVKPLILQAI